MSWRRFKASALFHYVLARSEGFEPPTPRFEVWCSIQLSYERRAFYYRSRRLISTCASRNHQAPDHDRLSSELAAKRVTSHTVKTNTSMLAPRTPRAMSTPSRNGGTTMAVADLPAFIRLLGVNVLHRSPERSEAELPVRAELCNRRGVLHGGAVMALGDTLGGMTASISLPDGGRTATIESKTNFFAAVPEGDTAHAVCMPMQRG